MGKSGIRPASGLGLTLHEAVSPEGVPQDRHRHPALRLLHYDAVSGEEFVRKWSALADAGHTRYRTSRAPMARALKTVVEKDLPDEVREKYLHRIYELTTRDDVELLGELGLLEEIDPVQGGQQPRDLPDGAADALAERVEQLRAEPKRPFYVADAPRTRANDAGAAKRGVRRLRRMAARRSATLSGGAPAGAAGTASGRAPGDDGPRGAGVVRRRAWWRRGRPRRPPPRPR